MLQTQTLTFYCDQNATAQPDQYEPEFVELLEIYRALAPRNVLEIGVRRGGTLYQWIKNTRKGACIAAVELPGGPWGIPGEPPVVDWHEAAKAVGVHLSVILGDSHSPQIVERVREGGPVDFLFIDGDHSYLGVAFDFMVYGQFVRPGGLVVLHDIVQDKTDDKIEVWRYWQEIKKVYRTAELLSSPDQACRRLGVVYV